MPANTTIGTNGYVAPFVREAGDDPQVTWTAGADRFALAVLLLETFAAQAGCAFAGDGSLLDQDEIQVRAGATLDRALAAAEPRAAEVARLFPKVLAASAPGDCPSPRDWLRAVHRSRPRATRIPMRSPTGFVPLDVGAFVALDSSRFVRLTP